MKQKNIPFQLGMQYENWEFDLEPIQDRVKGYDSYLYRGKEFNYFMNYSTDKTELIFSLDRLEIVILTFFNRDMNKLEELKFDLNTIDSRIILAKGFKCRKMEIQLIHLPEEKKIILVYSFI
ncbi:hypothetical protein ETU10_07555 [Apibacter muscae]|uniref:hypothetical protein n=1 Tax=Apibacter muscae TaxID=2509004 RepID=UPI0011AC02EF|nr:hypothetical protein [Apibacter muscae]TWP23570.1 hypothetical protein ETU10_07555 [Apibacter muscae]